MGGPSGGVEGVVGVGGVEVVVAATEGVGLFFRQTDFDFKSRVASDLACEVCFYAAGVEDVGGVCWIVPTVLEC